jgi:hypothetical protein
MTELRSPASGVAPPPERTLDTKTAEVLALTVFRAIFRNGVHVPLKVKGMMDMDLVIRDSNVILNMNAVQMEVLELSIWRITFAYRGKPVIEYGRGIKNDMKIHLPQLCFLLLAIWQERRKKSKAKARGETTRGRELVTMSVTDPSAAKAEETTG